LSYWPSTNKPRPNQLVQKQKILAFVQIKTTTSKSFAAEVQSINRAVSKPCYRLPPMPLSFFAGSFARSAGSTGARTACFISITRGSWLRRLHLPYDRLHGSQSADRLPSRSVQSGLQPSARYRPA